MLFGFRHQDNGIAAEAAPTTALVAGLMVLMDCAGQTSPRIRLIRYDRIYLFVAP